MIYTISNDYLTVKVSSKGGELQSVQTKDGHEYIWQGDPASWNRHAPNLFPFVGRFNKGKYLYKGNEYEIGQHGFLRDNELNLVSLEDSKLVLSFEETKETLKVYPFKFKITLTYTIDNNTLSTSYDINNNGDDTMYFGIGGHPGFNVPVNDTIKFDDYYLQFEDGLSPKQTILNEDYWFERETKPYTLENGNRINLTHELFNHDAIILSDAGKTVELKSDKSDRSILFDFDNFEMIAFWQAYGSEPAFVCIEPWTSHSSFEDEDISDLETKTDLVKLPAKESFNRHWSITVK